jgi:hypothetical protein
MSWSKFGISRSRRLPSECTADDDRSIRLTSQIEVGDLVLHDRAAIPLKFTYPVNARSVERTAARGVDAGQARVAPLEDAAGEHVSERLVALDDNP